METFCRLLRRPEVEKITGKSRSEIYDQMQKGLFPLQVRLSANGRAVGWPADEIVKYVTDRIAERDRRVSELPPKLAASPVKQRKRRVSVPPPGRRRTASLRDIGQCKRPIFAKAMIDEALRGAGPTATEIKPIVTINGPDELESAFATMAREQADVVIVQGSLVTKPLADMAIKYHLPAASSTRAFADIGGLMSFGADGPAAVRHGAQLVQKVLQGKAPKDIPVEQPTK